MIERTAWRVVAAITGIVGAACVVLGVSWHVPVAVFWGAFLILLARISVLG